MTRRGHAPRWALLAAAVWLVAAPVAAVTDLASVGGVADISLDLDGTITGPQNVVVDAAAGGVSLIDFGELPAGVRITAYARTADGAELLSFDIPVVLYAFTMRPGDVLLYRGKELTLIFDAAANGVPRGVGVDAVTEVDGALALSFTSAVALDNGAVVAEKADLVRRHGDTFTVLFDASAYGVPDGLDLDGAQVLANGHLLLSFDGSGRIEGVDFDDEDVLELDPQEVEWALVYDGSAAHPQWRDADLTALFAVVVPDTPTATAIATVTATRTRTHTAGASATPVGSTVTELPATPTPPATATAVPTGGGATVTPTPDGICAADCDADGAVAINELILIVNIALGQSALATCPGADRSGDGTIAINEIIAAVNEALAGCPTDENELPTKD